MIFLELFWTFFKIGAFTFGGGYAMLPLIQAEVTSKGWISEESIVNFVAVSESTPGPFAVNMATYVGSEMGGVFGVGGGIFGAFCATLGVVLPSFVIILIVAQCFQKFQSSRVIRGCMSGLKPAVIGLIASAVISIGTTVFIPNGFMWEIFTQVRTYIFLGIAALALVLGFKKLHPIIIICISAVLGIAAGYLGFL
ncbi:MAG: chromate transporter [Oscillospiraceae bacterium]|nr:chromate transporter [Oscillospiraceae bacterium]